MISYEEFHELARTRRVIPVVHTVLADGETALSAYRKLAGDRPGTFLLESASYGKAWSRYSFIGAGARSALIVKDGNISWIGQQLADMPVAESGANPFDILADILDLLHTDADPSLPPLTSGLIGYCSYEMIRYLEKIPDTTVDDLQIPDMVQILAESIAVVDHYEGVIHLIANAINWDNSPERVESAYEDAKARIADMLTRLQSPHDLPINDCSPVTPQPRRQQSQEEYLERVAKAKEHIRAGDAFQIVLSQRYEMDTDVDGLDIYRVLRHTNPSPYMYFMNIPAEDFQSTQFQIIGSSPEALLTVKNNELTMHPIAGSAPRGSTNEEDLLLEKKLLADEKENSEHIMLVDLARNDMSRVCTPGTVAVRDFRYVERYSAIIHLVSDVVGQLAEDKNVVDAFCATFPAGTLTGAPKPSALSIIDQQELTRRGVYGGTVGYFDFSGNTDQAIAIRTGIYKEGTVYVQAGAGIVADSNPLSEDKETQHKAAAVLRAVATAQNMRVATADSISTANDEG